MTTKFMGVRLEDELVSKIKQLAIVNNTSNANALRFALVQFFEPEKQGGAVLKTVKETNEMTRIFQKCLQNLETKNEEGGKNINEKLEENIDNVRSLQKSFEFLSAENEEISKKIEAMDKKNAENASVIAKKVMESEANITKKYEILVVALAKSFDALSAQISTK